MSITLADLDQLVSAGRVFDVYRGRAVEGDGELAVKLSRGIDRPSLDELRRSLDEERAISEVLEGTAVVHTGELVEDEGRIYQLRPWVAGRSLRGWMDDLAKAGDRVPVDAALRIAAEVLRTAAKIHGLPVFGGGRDRFSSTIHGDLSPGHIILTPKGEVHVLGVRSAVTRWEWFKQDRQLLSRNSLHYVSPELARVLHGEGTFREVGSRSDVFTVGVWLTDLLNGEAPGHLFPEQRVIRSALGRPIQLDTSLDPDDQLLALQPLLARATAIDPNYRPRAKELAESFEELILRPARASREVAVAGSRSGSTVALVVRPDDQFTDAGQPTRRTTEQAIDRLLGPVDAQTAHLSDSTPEQQLASPPGTNIAAVRLRWADGITQWWEGVDPQLGRPVLIRVSEESIEAHVVAAQAHARLDPIGSVPCLLGATHDGTRAYRWFTQPAGAVATSRRKVDGPELRRVARSLLGILQRAHALNPPAVHGSISDACVLVSNEAVQILDFQGGEAVTRSYRVASARFFSDHLRRNPDARARPRDDLFAVGLLLWEMASGQDATPREKVGKSIALVVALENRRLPPLTVPRPDLPATLTNAIDRMVDSTPNRRPADAAAALALFDDDADDQRETTALKPGAVFTDKYELVRPLGKGGAASVWLARNVLIKTDVAIKVLNRKKVGNAKSRRRFLNEARIQANLIHPNIVQVFDVDTLPGTDQPYLVMAYVPGETLRDWIKDHPGPAHPREVLPWMIQVLSALDAAHNHLFEVYHRDVKPENILLDQSGNAMLSDFGIAATVEHESHAADFQPMTIVYAPPERVSGASRGRSAPADIFSVGLILWELLAGKHYIPRPHWTSLQALATYLVSADVPPLSSERDDLPRDLVDAVAMMTERDPENRFQSAKAAARALQMALAQVPRTG